MELTKNPLRNVGEFGNYQNPEQIISLKNKNLLGRFNNSNFPQV